MEIHIAAVPSILEVPAAMQEAHERLLSTFNSAEPPRVLHLQSLVSGPDSEIIVAVRAEHLASARDWQAVPAEDYVGTLSLLFSQTLTRDVAHIEHVVVDEACRGRGVGRRLLEHALELGSMRGVSRFDLTSSPSKVAAQALYRSAGFEQRATNNWRHE